MAELPDGVKLRGLRSSAAPDSPATARLCLASDASLDAEAEAGLTGLPWWLDDPSDASPGDSAGTAGSVLGLPWVSASWRVRW